MIELEDPSRAQVCKTIMELAFKHVGRMLNDDISHDMRHAPATISLHSSANEMCVVRAGHVVLAARVYREDFRDTLEIRKVIAGGWWESWIPLPNYRRNGLSSVSMLLGQTKGLAQRIRRRV